MGKQSYQEIFKIIKEDLASLSNNELNKIKDNFQEYFHNKQKENPKRYERLNFNTNGPEPSCRDLEDMLSELRVSKFLYTTLHVDKKKL